MKMFKQNKKLALLTVLLTLAMTVVLLAGAMISAFAAAVGSSYTLTINFQNVAGEDAFNGDSFKEIRYEIRPTGNPNDGIYGEPVSYEKGEITPNALTGVASIQISVPKEYYVFLYVVPSLGYSSSGLVEDHPTPGDRPHFESFTVADGDPNFIADAHNYPGMKYEIFVDSNLEYTNVISAKTTQIVFDRTENNQSYTFDDFDGDGLKDSEDDDDDNDGILDTTDDNNRSLSITYQKDDVVLPLPVIGNGEAYEFDKWMLVKADGSTEELPDRTLTKGTMLLEMHTTGEVHVRPTFKKRSYDVQKLDVVFDKDRGHLFSYVSSKLIDYNGDGVEDWIPETKKIEYETFVNAMTLQNSFFDLSAERWGYVLFTPDLIDEAGIDAATYESIMNSYATRVVKTTDNVVLRYYLPITYNVTIDANGGTGSTTPFVHVFNNNTPIDSQLTRVGYTFAGWNVKINGALLIDEATGAPVEIHDGTLHANFKPFAIDNAANAIELVASWTPITFTVKYDNAYSSFADGSHVFDKETTLLVPERVGYIFKGWNVKVQTAEGPVLVGEGKFTLDASNELYAQGNDSCLYLESTWEAKQYTVSFDGNVGNTGDAVNNLQTNPFTATYDQTVADTLIMSVPTREGYRFMGYYTTMDDSGVCYFDEYGKGTNILWNTDSTSNSITLYAVWAALPYDVSFTFNNVDLIESIVVLVNGEEIRYNLTNPAPISVPYRAQFTVIVTAKNGCKIVEWHLDDIDHTTQYLFNGKDQTGIYGWSKNQEFSFTVYPVVDIDADDFKIDYATETLKPASGTSFAPGRYTIKDYKDEIWMELTVLADGTMLVNNAEIDSILLEESFLGKTLRIIARGHDGIDADSDLIVISIAGRQQPPSELPQIRPSQDKIEILNHSNLYQYSISQDPSMPSGVWQDSPIFETLADGSPIIPGTTYYVFIRTKHTETAPHSDPLPSVRFDTMYTGYVTDTKNALDALKQEGDGDFVQAVIDNAKAEIDRIIEIHPTTFYVEIERVVEIATAEIPLAREKDKALNALRTEQEKLLASGSYDATGQATMEQILNQAQQDIALATNSEQIQIIRNEIREQLRDVKITVVIVTTPSKEQNFRVEHSEGMSSETSITLERLSEEKLKEIAEKYNLAIRNGKVVSFKPTVSTAAMLKALETQDVMAGYHIGGTFEKTASGVYKISLLLPADLQKVHSLRVAYYNDETGTVEILDAIVDGQYLKFNASKLADFVVFGDPTIELILPMAILGGTFLLQLIAIIYLIARRRKVAKTVRLNSFALPIMALTIRFDPVFGLPVVLALGALVIIAQIVLVVLLLTSDIIRRSPNDQLTPEEMAEKEEETPITPVAPLYEEDAEILEDEPALTELTDPDVAPNEEDVQDDTEYAYALESEGEPEEMTESDPFAIYDEPAALEDEDPMDFIEPAANPNYSLPDEEEIESTVELAEEETDLLEESATVSDDDDAFDAEVIEDESDTIEEHPAEEAFADQTWESEEIVEEDFAAIDPETELFYDEETAETPVELDEPYEEEEPIEELPESDEEVAVFEYDEETAEDSFEDETAEPEEYAEEESAQAYEEESAQDEIEPEQVEETAEEDAAEESTAESEEEEPEELFYSEEDVPDIDDSYLAQPASGEDEIPDIDDSKQYE